MTEQPADQATPENTLFDGYEKHFIKNMTASYIDTPDSDLKVVNAARVSFAKMQAEFDATKDSGLIRYLATHDHWTPFAHVRNTFALTFVSYKQALEWVMALSQEQVAGMVWHFVDADRPRIIVRHSLYGWVSILKGDVPFSLQTQYVAIYRALQDQYPVSIKYLLAPTGIYEYSYNSEDLPTEIHDTVEVVDNPYFEDFTLKLAVPIFVARQDFKHMVGRVFNEVSRRYVDSTPDLFVMDDWREKADNKKQGSSDTLSAFMTEDLGDFNRHDLVLDHYAASLVMYDGLIANKVCAEQSRANLPQAMMTEYYVTAHMAAWNRVLRQRLMDDHAQKEIRNLAELIKIELTKAMNGRGWDFFD